MPADETTVAPAVAVVDARETNATSDLFEAETLQLTDAVLANLTRLELTNVTLFSFQNESDSKAEMLAKSMFFGKCKSYPGDFLYPPKILWKLFDILLGKGLTETVPYAAACYDSFGNYDAAKCDFITNNWINASIYQYVPKSHNDCEKA